MLFNSYNCCFVFFPLTLAGLYLLARFGLHKTAIVWMGIASLVFYSQWEPWHVFILLGSVLVNFYLGGRIIALQAPRSRLLVTVAGVSLNLALLFIYKYSAFAAENISALLSFPLSVPKFAMPIGISFFTFTQISYLVDAYKKKVHTYSFPDYLLFVTFFPHLVAGPILRHHSVIPQLQSTRFGRPSARFAYIGLAFFCCGLFKKVMIADTMSPVVGQLFNAGMPLSFTEAWCAALLYTMQLYYDFSGYSEMAMGLAFLLNVKIPLNFNSPYRSRSMIEFWRRWHISLSAFLRDYVYIPLGGSRKGKARHLANLLMTMVLCGIWHGAGWTFVFWGAWHGVLLVGNHLWRMTRVKLPALIGWALAFTGTVVGWVWFRAHDMSGGWRIVSAMLGIHGSLTAPESILNGMRLHHVLVALAFFIPWTALAPNVRYYALRRKPPVLFMIVFAYMLVLSILNMANPAEFLYFQF